MAVTSYPGLLRGNVWRRDSVWRLLHHGSGLRERGARHRASVGKRVDILGTGWRNGCREWRNERGSVTEEKGIKITFIFQLEILKNEN